LSFPSTHYWRSNMSQTSVVIVNAKCELLAQHKPRSTRLPAVHVQKDQAGFSLFTALVEQIGLEVFWLLPPEGRRTTLPLLRLQSDTPVLPLGYSWVQPHDLTSGPMPEPDLFDRLNITGQCLGEYRWYPQVQDWLRETVARMGHELRALEPWNSSAGNVLLRVLTDGPPLWFKAVSDHNWKDFLVTQALKDLYPEDRPRILAIEPSWKTMLLEHVQGTSLAECTSLRRCQSVARKLADVQRRYSRQTDVFLRADATDLRASTLLMKAPRFFESLARAIERQYGADADQDGYLVRTPMSPSAYQRSMSRVTMSELREMIPLVPALCTEVASFPLSEGLCNVSSFEPRNAILTSAGLVIVDWAEACVSWPLAANRSLWHRLANVSLRHASWCTLARVAHQYRWEKSTGLPPLFSGVFLADAFFSLAMAVLYSERHTDEPPDDRELLRFGELLKLTIHSAFEGYRESLGDILGPRLLDHGRGSRRGRLGETAIPEGEAGFCEQSANSRPSIATIVPRPEMRPGKTIRD
jgi:hypothetical protein